MTENKNSVTDNQNENGQAVTDYEGPVTDFEGKVTDYEGPVTDYEGPVTDHEGPVTDYEGPVVDDASKVRFCPVENCGKMMHRVKFFANNKSVDTHDYCITHGPVGNPVQKAKKEEK
jgi:hypothetical protein